MLKTILTITTKKISKESNTKEMRRESKYVTTKKKNQLNTKGSYGRND